MQEDFEHRECAEDQFAPFTTTRTGTLPVSVRFDGILTFNCHIPTRSGDNVEDTTSAAVLPIPTHTRLDPLCRHFARSVVGVAAVATSPASSPSNTCDASGPCCPVPRIVTVDSCRRRLRRCARFYQGVKHDETATRSKCRSISLSTPQRPGRPATAVGTNSTVT